VYWKIAHVVAKIKWWHQRDQYANPNFSDPQFTTNGNFKK
jgi:hypothetical protein